MPDRFKKLVRDWPSLDVPNGINVHDLAYKCSVPTGSYLIGDHKVYVETQAHAEAMAPLIAAAAIGLPVPVDAKPAEVETGELPSAEGES